MNVLLRLVLFVALFASVASLQAQSKSMCKTFFESTAKLHTRVECTEALFSDPKFHFTFSSLPPGNGFALGGMFEDEVDNVYSSGKLSSKQAKLSIVGSVNQSWVASGVFDLTPPLYTPDRNKNNEVCQRLGIFCTKTQFSLHAQGTPSQPTDHLLLRPRPSLAGHRTYLSPERHLRRLYRKPPSQRPRRAQRSHSCSSPTFHQQATHSQSATISPTSQRQVCNLSLSSCIQTSRSSLQPAPSPTLAPTTTRSITRVLS
jgi:hypothetical protein